MGPAVLLCALFIAAALPLIAINFDRGRAAGDQDGFYLVDVQAFARQWPHFDFSDYSSATTPGLFVVMAGVYRAVSHDVRVLRLVAGTFTLGLILMLGIAVARRVPGAAAFVLCVPFVCCIYVFEAGAWVTPENAAWWGVLAILLVALRPRSDTWLYLVGGVALFVAVVTRQTQLWAAGVLCGAAWLGSGSRLWPAGHAAPDQSWAARFGRTAVMLASVAPALAALLWLFHLWHGATPPSSRIDTGAHPALVGGNPASPALAFAVVGFAGIFYVGWLAPALRSAGRSRAIAFGAAGLVIGTLAGALPLTSFDRSEGRLSGLWNFARLTPTFHGHAPVIIVLAAAGGLLFGLWMAAVSPRDRWIFLLAWAGCIAAHSAVSVVYQRFYEPLVLMMLPLMASRTASRDGLRPGWLCIAGPALLAVLYAAITVRALM